MYKLTKSFLIYNSINQSFSRSFYLSGRCLAKNYYEILGVNKNSDSKEIKSKYYKLAKKYHPDVNKDNKEYAKKFQEVSEAYEILGDPEKREQYDNFGSSFNNQQFASGNYGSNSYSQSFHSNIDPEELFRRIFKEFSEGMQSGMSSDNANDFASSFFGSNPTNEIMLDLTLEEAVKGVEKEIVINCVSRCPKCHGKRVERGTGLTNCSECSGTGVRTTSTGPFIMQQTCQRCGGTGKVIRYPCSECEGTGNTVQRRRISVSIPAGIDHGQTIRKVINDGRSVPQEIYVTIKLINSDKFIRQGDDIYSILEIPFALAAIGGKVKVDGIYNSFTLEIPAGTNSNDKISAPEKGIKRMNRFGYGAHIFTIKLLSPKRLSDFQRALLEVLADSEGVSSKYELKPTSSAEVEYIKNLLRNFSDKGHRGGDTNSSSNSGSNNPSTESDSSSLQPLTWQDVMQFARDGWEMLKRSIFRR